MAIHKVWMHPTENRLRVQLGNDEDEPIDQIIDVDFDRDVGDVVSEVENDWIELQGEVKSAPLPTGDISPSGDVECAVCGHPRRSHGAHSCRACATNYPTRAWEHRFKAVSSGTGTE